MRTNDAKCDRAVYKDALRVCVHESLALRKGAVMLFGR